MSDEIQVLALQFTGDHERYDSREAAKAWVDLDRVLMQAGLDQEGRDFTHTSGREYGYLHTEDGKVITVVSDLEWSSAECQQETGVAWPFGRQASGILRDNEKGI